MKDKAWLGAVASLESCVLCGAWGVQVAHRNEGKAKARKNPDGLTAALCPTCHVEIDSGAHLTRAERRSLMDRAIVLTLLELLRRGLVGVKKRSDHPDLWA